MISKLTLNLGRQWEMPAWGTGGATVIAAMGDYYKQVFISRRVDSERIFVTGSPLFDNLSGNASAIVADRNASDIKELSNKAIVLLITQPFVEDGTWTPNHRTSYVKSVMAASRQINARLIIKVHPRENLNVYNALANNFGSDIFVTKDTSLDQLLVSSDVAITVSSTAGLSAIIHKKPLIVISYFPKAAENILEDMAMPVYEPEKLSNIIDQILKNKTIRENLVNKGTQSLKDHLYKLDGQSSKRIAKLIIQITKKVPNKPERQYLLATQEIISQSGSQMKRIDLLDYNKQYCVFDTILLAWCLSSWHLLFLAFLSSLNILR